MAAETKAYKKIPVINEFKDEDGNDIMQQQIDRNYSRIKADVLQIIEEEMARIANDPDLKHLIPQKEDDKRRIEQVRFLFQPAKVVPCPPGLSKAKPLRVSAKSSALRLRYFPESLAQSGTGQ